MSDLLIKGQATFRNWATTSWNSRNRQDLPKYQGSGGNQPDGLGAKQRKRPFRAGISGKVVSTGFGSSGP